MSGRGEVVLVNKMLPVSKNKSQNTVGGGTTLTPHFERMFPLDISNISNIGTLADEPKERERLGGGAPSSSSYTAPSDGTQSGAGATANQLRQMIQQCLDNGIVSTACLLADKLLRMPLPREAADARLVDTNRLADQLLLARCYLASNEPRRCLAALERRELLSAQIIGDLSDTLSPTHALGDGDDMGHVSSPPPALFFLHMQGVMLAAQCLVTLEQYEDCTLLLDPLLFVDSSDDGVAAAAASVAREVYSHYSSPPNNSQIGAVNVVAAMYSLAGRCFDLLENRPRAVSYLVAAIRVDPACVEAVEYLTERCLLSTGDRAALYETLHLSGPGGIYAGREWLDSTYRFLLLGGLGDDLLEPSALRGQATQDEDTDQGGDGDISLSPLAMVRLAERLYEHQYSAEAYRLARQAYVQDSFDRRGLLLYIASMVELGLTTELFYLGHELSHSRPKLASSWYAVGCYYWSSKKMELAQKFLQKAVKMDKHFAAAWIVLGHVLAAQEESEHAISAFRSASRLLPGDHRPLMYMAKELVRTNYLSLALHLLVGSLRIQPQDPALLNELGVVLMKQGRLDEAIEHLSLAASILQQAEAGGDGNGRESAVRIKHCGDEIFSNYATALRRVKRFDEALHWYRLCLTVNPTDACTHASIGFTLHLMERPGEAVEEYHKALALQPTFSFAADMLSRAMGDALAQGGGAHGLAGVGFHGSAQDHSFGFGRKVGEKGGGRETPPHLRFDIDPHQEHEQEDEYYEESSRSLSQGSQYEFLQHGTLDSSNSMDL